ncbi:hypothetical protein I4F81_009334 [Pyropia yezoensis]|uniref:Uncharacterized protein n=1 Tax=Pyropia yezoensis TaxID=2788 RepID=A0ACC3C9H1_PYRYE|nr:hypothetical protein I4F81_009334 [Neopyropia yezoensis]
MWSSDVIGNAANATTAVGAELASLRESHAPALLGWLLLGGVVIAFTGHSLLTPLVFLVGASPAVAFAFYVAGALELDSLADGQAALLFVATVIGIASGLLACRLLLPVAAFALAATLGGVAAALLQSVLLYRLLPSRPELLFSVGAAFLALAFGALSLRVPDAMVMASTAGIGSYVSVSAVGVLAGDWPAELSPLSSSAAARELPPVVRLGYAAATLTLTALGTFTQARVRRAWVTHHHGGEGRRGGGVHDDLDPERSGHGSRGGGGGDRDDRGDRGDRGGGVGGGDRVGGGAYSRRLLPSPPSRSRDGVDGYDDDDWEAPARSSRGTSRKPPRRHRGDRRESAGGAGGGGGGGGGGDGTAVGSRPHRGASFPSHGYGSTGSAASDDDETRSLVDGGGGRYGGRRGRRGGGGGAADDSDIESGRAPSVEGRRAVGGGGDDAYDTFAKAAHGLAAAPLKPFDGPGEDAGK